VLRAAVIGEPGAGSTTVLGLLYAALIRWGGDRADPFRFFAPPAALAYLSSSYQRLMAGEFPEPPSDPEIATVQIDLAYRRRPGLLDRIRPGPEFPEVPQVECRWVRAPLHDLARSLAGIGAPPPGGGAGLAGCRVPIFVVPADGTGATEGTGTASAPGTDENIREILQRLAGPSAVQGGGPAPPVHPVFVFTKLDRISPDLLKSSGVAGSLDEEALLADRPRLATGFLGRILPRPLEGLGGRANPPAGPPVFFSYVHPEPPVPGAAPRLRMRASPGRLVEPEYPWTQYRSLLEHLGELASGAE